MHRIASEVGQQVKTVNNQECLKQAFTICISNDPEVGKLEPSPITMYRIVWCRVVKWENYAQNIGLIVQRRVTSKVCLGKTSANLSRSENISV